MTYEGLLKTVFLTRRKQGLLQCIVINRHNKNWTFLLLLTKIENEKKRKQNKR